MTDLNRTGEEVDVIDSSLFAVEGVPARPLEFETEIAASPGAVFDALTSSDQIQQWLGVASNVELRIGGPYELYFDAGAEPGSRGSEGCQILAYVPGETLAVSWNSPPTLPEIRRQHTWVVYSLHSRGAGSHLRLVHTGMGDGDIWEQNRAYFQAAWPSVLTSLRRHFE